MTIPIPQRPSGFMLGAANADVTIDLFVDIQCPHSRAIWPTIIALIDHYQGQSVSVRTHLITLSNHRQAWDMSLGLFALAEGGSQAFYSFATFLYEHQAQFYNGEFLHKTHEDLKQLVADFAVQHAAVDRAAFLERMVSHDVYIQARTPIRYAATRSVWATPTIFVNNAGAVPVDHKSSLADWQALIDPLLASSEHA